ncbi:hypothetical protein PSMK_30100 [Phycisphaera mikurensis NBRC 102666]|uniref:Uncharacterized protein n=1 Tax=Phycisphaera mikurensis (strain NBRC 102666 / KCTC 22515 / FYK2301M01) TaxID=1142394 RepID=I0IIT1_PHYMF|nr:hypothetical protein PSMK_30100 [Phycisphaera mikurensis NBRC 102666]
MACDRAAASDRAVVAARGPRAERPRSDACSDVSSTSCSLRRARGHGQPRHRRPEDTPRWLDARRSAGRLPPRRSANRRRLIPRRVPSPAFASPAPRRVSAAVKGSGVRRAAGSAEV